MAPRFASVFVRQGKAYLPVIAQTETGLFMGVEPVYMTDLASESLVSALEKVLAAGHPRIPHPAQKEWQRLSQKDPVLQAAGVKNWKEFSQHNAVYDIEWTEQAVTVYILQLDHLGRAEYASAKKINFAKGASLQTIAKAILEDIHSQPELLIK